MASRTAPKTSTSRAWTGSRAAPQGKERRAHAAKKDRDPAQRAAAEPAPPTGGRGKAPMRGRQDRSVVPFHAHHPGGGVEAEPAAHPKRRAVEREPEKRRVAHRRRGKTAAERAVR